MSNMVEKYFSLLTKEQIARVNEIAIGLYNSGTNPSNLFYIKFTGDVSGHPDEVVDLVPTIVENNSTFPLRVLMDINLKNLASSLVLEPVTIKQYPSAQKKQQRKEIGEIGMLAVRTMISTKGTNQKENVSKSLHNKLMELKTRYG